MVPLPDCPVCMRPCQPFRITLIAGILEAWGHTPCEMVFTGNMSLQHHNHPKKIIPALQMRKRRLSEVKMLVQGRITGKQQGGDSNPGASPPTGQALCPSSTGPGGGG